MTTPASLTDGTHVDFGPDDVAMASEYYRGGKRILRTIKVQDRRYVDERDVAYLAQTSNRLVMQLGQLLFWTNVEMWILCTLWADDIANANDAI
jgi:hypothetical protein